MGKRIVSVLLCALLLCLCAGCGSYKADASFTYLLEQNVTSLDPQTASNSAAELVISSLFEGLCRIDEDGEAIPGVARSWEANSDSTEFTFHLRRNAQWSDGTPLTAQEILEQEEGEAPAAPEETAPSEEAWEEIDQEIRDIQAEGEDPDKKEP